MVIQGVADNTLGSFRCGPVFPGRFHGRMGLMALNLFGQVVALLA